MKGSKPLTYSKSSIPTIWRKVMTGKLSSADACMPSDDDIMPMATTTKKERMKMEKAARSTQEPTLAPEPPEQTLRVVSPPQAAAIPAAETKPVKTTKKSETKSAAQAVVVAGCPYCSHKHELALEKGKNGKPFFVECARCSKEFAVRYVPVTVYQAQVAAFV
jgi:DNA-directed RNA polymerase subunit RPC12/RpoP